MSLLERLMKQCDLYQKDPVTLKYNEKVITKLVNNYRSHEKILHVSNLRFYDNELVVSTSMSWDHWIMRLTDFFLQGERCWREDCVPISME